MKRIQGNPWCKLAAVLVLLISAFGAGISGVHTLMRLQYVVTDNWQETEYVQRALSDRQEEVIAGIADSIQLERLREELAEGKADAMTYADIEALEKRLQTLEGRLDPAQTWFRFAVRSTDGSVLITNMGAEQSVSDVSAATSYVVFRAGEHIGAVWDATAEQAGISDRLPVSSTGEGIEELETLVLESGVPSQVSETVQDEFYRAWMTFQNGRANFDGYLTGLLNLLALVGLALAFLLWSAGHRTGEEGIVLTWQEKIYFDLYAAAVTGACVALTAGGLVVGEELYFMSYHAPDVAGEGYLQLAAAGLAALFTGLVAAVALLLRTLAVRLKARCLVRTTLLCRVVTWMVRTIRELIQFLPFTWKAVLGFLAYFVLNLSFFTNAQYNGGFELMWFALNIGILLLLSWWAMGYHRLRKGTRIIAGGDLEYQIDTARMPHDLRLQAEDLNNISVGLSSAVDEKMKSERFKAELITNVSHDLKTPLTSIINYVNLLKSTEQTDPKAVEYIEVLDRKSQRLKKLTEDLVEASKASTGVLSVNREKIGMSQLIDQAMGEWEEKLQARSLTLMLSLPEGETWVYADGRHLWRVLDNLLSNCSKYAMEGTRVYLDLVRGKGQVVLSVKNISREPLNVPPERLMERFVRGEESRTTEGSGLGLSIARSLTELQGGEFRLAVDGDLFKAIVTLPQAN